MYMYVEPPARDYEIHTLHLQLLYAAVEAHNKIKVKRLREKRKLARRMKGKSIEMKLCQQTIFTSFSNAVWWAP